MLSKATEFIINEKGQEVISERHQKDFQKPSENGEATTIDETSTESFTDVDFDDI
jgi:hypothetical protein